MTPTALVTSDRKLHEMVKFSPYGVPFGLPGGDTDSEGDNDAADATQIQAWIDAPAYDLRGDVDLDGDVDGADKTLAQGSPINGNVLGNENLSDEAIRSLHGFAGAISVCGQTMLNRNRCYLPNAGRWSRRDPMGYEDTKNLMEYCISAPVGYTDPLGLDVDYTPNSFSNASGGSVNVTGNRMPGKKNNVTKDIPDGDRAGAGASGMWDVDRARFGCGGVTCSFRLPPWPLGCVFEARCVTCPSCGAPEPRVWRDCGMLGEDGWVSPNNCQ